MFVKMSILFLYLRVFTEGHIFGYTIYALLLVIVASHISFIFTFLFSTTPVRCSWVVFETEEEFLNTCHDHVDGQVVLILFLFISSLTVVLDIIILSLPCRAVWRLHLPERQKLAILITLISGSV